MDRIGGWIEEVRNEDGGKQKKEVRFVEDWHLQPAKCTTQQIVATKASQLPSEKTILHNRLAAENHPYNVQLLRFFKTFRELSRLRLR